MKIELKNFKHAAFASEETMCFRATIYVDGVKTGEIENQGNGGASTIYCSPTTPNALELREKAEKYCESLPPYDIDGMSLEMDLEFFCELLAGNEVAKKKLKADLKNKIVLTKPNDPGVYTKSLNKGYKGKLTTAIIEKYQSDNPTFKVLNLMPFDKALQEYSGEKYKPLYSQDKVGV